MSKAGKAKLEPWKPEDSATVPLNGPPSWEAVEIAKIRIAELMDRVEYLTHAQNRLTDLTAEQTQRVRLAMTHHGRPVLERALHREIPDVEGMFKTEELARKDTKTVKNRLRALDSYVANEETRRGGFQCGEVARNQATKYAGQRGNMTAWLPNYRELLAGAGVSIAAGDTRRSPVLAVNCARPYAVPAEALQHGRRSLSATAPSSPGGRSLAHSSSGTKGLAQTMPADMKKKKIEQRKKKVADSKSRSEKNPPGIETDGLGD